MEGQNKTELKPSERFFAMVYQMRAAQKQFFKLHAAIAKETDPVKINDLKAQKQKMLDVSKMYEKQIDGWIDKVDLYYDKIKKEKFWT